LKNTCVLEYVFPEIRIQWNWQLRSLKLLMLQFLHRKEWILVREKSTFVDWQSVKVQELTDEVI
jgi:DNA replicative helicase MCM subunit Mcm2 (Cdc46/Mcm family)